MTQIDDAQNDFNTRHCLAKYRTEEVADCVSSTDVFMFCPFILRFGGGLFCRHPERDEIVERTEKLPKDTRGENPI